MTKEQQPAAQPVATVRRYNTGGNAGLAWHGVSLPGTDAEVRDGDLLYLRTAAQIDPAEVMRLADEYAARCCLYDKAVIGGAKDQVCDALADARDDARAALARAVGEK